VGGRLRQIVLVACSPVASANVELVPRMYEAWGRRHYSYSDWADPDVEYVVVDGQELGTWKGLAATREGSRGV
jgi:hypothetical protein